MKRLLIIVVPASLALMIAITVFFSAIAEKFIETHRNDFLGLSIDVDNVSISWATRNISFKGVTIYPAGKKEEKNMLVSADRLKFKINILELLTRTIHITGIDLRHPKVQYISAKGKSNWDALNLEPLKKDATDNPPKEKESAEWTSWKICIDKVKLKDGEILWIDMTSGGKFELRDVNAEIKNLITEPNPEKLPSKISLDAKLAGSNAPLNVEGKLNLFTDSLNMKLKGSLKGAPLTYFAPFYAGSVPFKITSGTLGIKSNFTVLRNYLTSTHLATISNLKASGLKGKIVTELVEKTGGTVNVEATVNGDLTKGNLRVSSAISKNIGDALIAKAKNLLPTADISNKVKKTGSKLTDKVKGVFR